MEKSSEIIVSDNKNLIGDRLLEAIKRLGYKNIANFVDDNGFNRATIYGIINQNRNPRSDILNRLREKRINIDFLLTGKGDPILPKPGQYVESNFMLINENMLRMLTEEQAESLVKTGQLNEERFKQELARRRKKAVGELPSLTLQIDALLRKMEGAKMDGPGREQDAGGLAEPLAVYRFENRELLKLIARAIPKLNKKELENLQFIIEAHLDEAESST